jgi:hypothetical protein
MIVLEQGRGGGYAAQGTRHAQVHNLGAAGEPDQQILPPSLAVEHRLAAHSGGQIGGHGPTQAGLMHDKMS